MIWLQVIVITKSSHCQGNLYSIQIHHLLVVDVKIYAYKFLAWGGHLLQNTIAQ